MSAMIRSALQSRAGTLGAFSSVSKRFYSAAVDGNPPIMAQIREGLKSAMKSGNNTE